MTQSADHRRPGPSEIRALLGDGKISNLAVARQLGVGVRAVARVRKDARLPVAPRSAWTRAPHPKDSEIRSLLGEGHTDAETRRRTGADVSTVARIRKDGGYGPATITRRGTRLHPKDAQIRQLINEGLSSAAVARQVGADRAAVRRIRAEMGVPSPPLQPLTLDEKWEERTRPVEGGHLEWTGERGTVSGTPLLRYREQTYTAAAVAFRRRTGTDPVGQVKADCGLHQCVAPDHVEDEPGRLAKREEIRRLKGFGDRPDVCPGGHDQGVHGRLEGDGRAYCEACKRDARKHPEAKRAARASAREVLRQRIEAMLREDIPQAHIASELGVAAATVQGVREALGLPAPRPGRRERYASVAEAFHASTQLLEDGHRRWTGGAAPYVCLREQRLAASPVSFELHHGRPPVGRARPSCGVNGCLAGSHLADRPMREANRRADRAFASIFGEAP
ncbi:hypothetical protein OG194_29785 [Streptomyces sp. NBC_01288]|uniref:hypothetical protein n=1 Tax=Streptomyces sp. NBC_01288 TaxID=2903814 RepID=UPI002E0D2370|nr:hypothetical protein OG194_29785 [Streptomyces sp. NBC_01288]